MKQELSQRYYDHYFNIIKNTEPPAASPPEDMLPPTGAMDSSKGESATGPIYIHQEKNGQPAESLSFDENLADINEISPIKLIMPASQESAAKPGEKNASEPKAKRKFCFIATAAYGSPLAQEVVLLQDFRDNYLSRNSLGENFVQGYYRISPYLARKISHYQVLKLLTRLFLTPIILLIKKSARR